MMRPLYKKPTLLFLAFCLVLTMVVPLTHQTFTATEGDQEDPELWTAVNPLNTIVSYMNTGAHPDDERSALLAYMSLGHGAQTSSVIANRGEGGQNVIGTELGNGLGIIRSRELEEASDVLNLDLRMLSQTLDDEIYDFGFSKTAEETLDIWGEELTYERFIRVIREERPDILFTSFRDVPSEHGHHRAMTILTERAFEDAADPEVFPEHLEEGLKPWQALKYYKPGDDEHETLSFNIGYIDPVYGLTYPQLGEESRFLHKSQGMGVDLPVEDYYFSLELRDTVVDTDEETIFSGVPYDFREYGEKLRDRFWENRLTKLQDQLEDVVEGYPSREDVLHGSQKSLREVRQLQDLLDRRAQGLTDEQQIDLAHRLDVKEEQLQEASAVASDLEITLEVDQPELTRGAETDFEVNVTHEGQRPIKHFSVSPVLPDGWEVDETDTVKHIKPGEEKSIVFQVKVDEDAELFHPYEPSVIQANVSYDIYGTEVNERITPEETVAVLPDFGLDIDPDATVLNAADEEQQIDVDVKVTNYVDGAHEGSIELDVPQDWEAEPQAASVSFAEQGEEQSVSFTLYPDDYVDSGEYSIELLAESQGEIFSTQVQPIYYDHIGQSYWLKPGNIDIQAFEYETVEGLSVGYVDSGFDEIAPALEQANIDVELIDEETLIDGDLEQYDTIVVGIRAYLSREELLEHNDRLMAYVENGGHVVMQYHNPWDNWSDQLPPYPIQPGQPSIEWRVTDQHSPVDILEPDHPFFHAPNAITDEDFEGWVQERGLYFPSEWDHAYTPLLSMADPDEDPFEGGLLVTDYGEGTYAYTSLVWYRQLQNQVAGGYRLFINLISYPHVDE